MKRIHNKGQRSFPSPDEIRMARESDLLEFIRRLGYSTKKNGANEQYLEGHDSLKISHNKWCWHSQNRLGGSCIDFVMHFPEPNQIAFKEAVWLVLDTMNLMDFNGEQNLKQPVAKLMTKSAEKEEIQPLILPPRHENANRVIAYLTHSRLIDRTIVLDMIRQKKLYESKDKHNCVFLGHDSSGEVRHAFNRGTLSGVRFAGDCPGSSKDYGFVMEGCSDQMYVFESPIDALSHATLTKLKGQDITQDTRLSLGCVSERAMLQYLKDYPAIKAVVLCLDNDKAGIQATKRIEEALQDSSLTVSAEPPTAKDFNEDLVLFMQRNRQKVMG